MFITCKLKSTILYSRIYSKLMYVQDYMFTNFFQRAGCWIFTSIALTEGKWVREPDWPSGTRENKELFYPWSLTPVNFPRAIVIMSGYHVSLIPQGNTPNGNWHLSSSQLSSQRPLTLLETKHSNHRGHLFCSIGHPKLLLPLGLCSLLVILFP